MNAPAYQFMVLIVLVLIRFWIWWSLVEQQDVLCGMRYAKVCLSIKFVKMILNRPWRE